MSFGTITSTSNTFGSLSGEVNCVIPGTLTGSVGVPGPAGSPGAPGVGVPAGGSTGQVLQKLSATSYDTGWLTLGTMAAQTASDYSTTAVANGLYYPLSGNPSGFLTASALTPYLEKAGGIITGNITSNNNASFISFDNLYKTAILNSASVQLNNAGPGGSSLTIEADGITFPGGGISKQTVAYPGIAALDALFYPLSGNPSGFLTDAPSNGSQYARKNAAWDVVIAGDRYLTSSTTSNTVSNGNKTFTIGTGLSYTPTQNISISYDASNHMHGEVLTYNSGTGVLTVDIKNHTGSGTYTSWVVNVGGVTPATSVAWGAITGVLASQLDLQGALDLKLAVTTAAATYLPLSGGNMPAGSAIVVLDGGIYVYESVLQNSGLLIRDSASTPLARFQADEVLIPSVGITFSDLTVQTSAGISAATVASTYAPLASPALTGNVTISSSTGAALFIEQTGTGNILTLHDQATDTTFVAIDANGKVSTIASEATNGAGFNIAHGAAPTSPVNGDIWTTTTGLFARINAGTRQFATLSDGQSFSGNNTFTGPTLTFGNSTAASTVNIGTGATLTATTKAVNIGTAGVAGSTTNITVGPVLGASTTSIGNTTAASTLNLAAGATLTATTKAVNIGTAGVAGSTTNIAIGSTTGTSTTTLQGTTNGVTAAADTNSVALATTAYVVGQAGSATPLVNGTAAVGTSLRYARQDHVHPTDTTRLATANNLSELTATASTARTNLGLGTIATVNEAPSDGSTYGRNNGAWVVAGGGGGGGADVQIFSTAGTFTWTKPAGKTVAWVRMWSGGGGGGSGTRQSIATQRYGGGGGAAGAMLEATIPLSALGATQSVTVGAGGAGGAAVTTDSTAGNNGGVGTHSTFSNYRTAANASGNGKGGSTTAGAGGSFTASIQANGWTATTAAPAGTAGGNGLNPPSNGGLASNLFVFPTGGGGGNGAGGGTNWNGGTGGPKTAQTNSGLLATVAGGAGGTTASVPPTSGTSGISMLYGGTGGGGGAYISGVAGMAGAAGSSPGGGGGGGAASDNGFASGAGGAGGAGAVIIVCY